MMSKGDKAARGVMDIAKAIRDQVTGLHGEVDDGDVGTPESNNPFKDSLFYRGRNGWRHDEVSVGPDGLILPHHQFCSTYKLEKEPLAEVWCFECGVGFTSQGDPIPQFWQVSHLATCCPNCGAEAYQYRYTPGNEDFSRETITSLRDRIKARPRLYVKRLTISPDGEIQK